MPQRKEQRRAKRKRVGVLPTPRKSFWRQRWLIVTIALVAIGITAWAVTRPTKKVTAVTSSKASLPTLMELVEMTPQQLENVDIALMNLRCAEGLPGSEGLKISAALEKLEQYAKHVEAETLRHLYKYRENPAEFQNSEAYFRMLVLATVLQEDFKVRYNPKRIEPLDALQPDSAFCADSKDVFLHGLTGPPAMGTCASMPVLYVAVGRRLGYPLYLVTAKRHLLRVGKTAAPGSISRQADEAFRAMKTTTTKRGRTRSPTKKSRPTATSRP
jgi:hypothetical protein